MKRILLLLLVLASFKSQAQWSAGIRTGIGFWGVNAFNENTFQYEETKKMLWQQHVYARYELSKEFALEGGVGGISTETSGEVFGLCGTGLPDEYEFISGNRYREQVYTLDLRVMFCPSFLHWGRLSNELGVVVAPGIATTETLENVVEVRVDGMTEHELSSTDSRTCIQLGLEDQLRYRIGNHIDLFGIGGFRIQNGARFFNNGVYAHVGLGYRF